MGRRRLARRVGAEADDVTDRHPKSPYLTAIEKEATLAYFAKRRVDLRSPSEPGGDGTQDPEVLPLCDRINALDGLCTVQSCSGHRQRQPGGKSAWASEACVWLRVSCAWHDALLSAGFDLAALRNVYDVAAHFDRVDGAVWRINFAGLDVEERPTQTVKESVDRLARFFEGLAPLAGWDAM